MLILTLHVETSPDGNTQFTVVADVLDHLATLWAWHPEVYGFLITRANEARQIDQKLAPEHLSGT